MRMFFAMVLPLAFISSTALAQPTPQPTDSALDQQQQSKLAAWDGTWQCNPVGGGAAETSTTSLQGSYYVTRYTGKQSLTAYSRWDSIDRAYYTVRLLDDGRVQVFKTTSADPANGVWVAVFPERIKDRSVETTLSGNRMTWGDMKTFGIDCRKT